MLIFAMIDSICDVIIVYDFCVSQVHLYKLELFTSCLIICIMCGND